MLVGGLGVATFYNGHAAALGTVASQDLRVSRCAVKGITISIIIIIMIVFIQCYYQLLSLLNWHYEYYYYH